MKAAFCIPIVLLFFMDGGVLAELPPPINVRIESINMELVLQWDVALNTTDNITYTAEYRGFYLPYKAVCGNITALRCDFSSVLLPFGVYSFRVRAELQREGSPWVEILDFGMDEHTKIGPPSVILNASGINIEVTIEDPAFRIKKFRDVYTRASYNITYWEKDQRDKAIYMSDIEQHRLVLPYLKFWTSYCVQAQVKTLRFNKLSQPSDVVCETTGKEGDKAWVLAVVIIVVVAVLVGLVVCGVLYGKKMVRFIWPKVKLPKHFKEYLWEPRDSCVFMAVQTSPPPQEVFHPVRVMAEDTPSEFPPTATGLTVTDHDETTVGETVNGGWVGRKEEERTVI
ncbi:interleukin-10 receptor subunit beta-like isoform X1 [Osmerus eperlanus]|uniref:interleukin-10 receptor subunit beta-like isoform X1 n=1 Tax=Osmerus eperlanus TaxID=29151 RepID=UPI002E132A7A